MKQPKQPKLTDPRIVGGRYFSSYWHQAYTVISITNGEMTVRWDDGYETTHCTAWDHKRDRVL